MEISTIFRQEGAVLNGFFRANKIRAKVDWGNSFEVKTGYLKYALLLDPRERFSRIEGSRRELSAVVSRFRTRIGLDGDIQLLPTTVPTPSLETPHPSPKILRPSNGLLLEGEPHTATVGRSYLTRVKEEQISFNDTPHILIAGTTNAGKSVLLKLMLLGLAARTSPADLKFLLIDLKNEDLIPLRRLPHTLQFAGLPSEAADVIGWMEREKVERTVDPTRKPFRIVLVIDELAHLTGNRDVINSLGLMTSIGRSKLLNMIGATQHPTKEGGLGPLMKANFGERFVGQVTPGTSQFATGRPGTHAEALPGKGAFLRCKGPDVYRIQSYYLSEDEVETMVDRIARQWKYSVREEPEVDQVEDKPIPVSPREQGTVTPVKFPLDRTRPLTPAEAAYLRKLSLSGELNSRGEHSWNKTQLVVFGGRSPERKKLVQEALG